MIRLTLGSLFDEISVFALAASHSIHHLGDTTKVKDGEILTVHIIIFGSTCQNLSNIRKREDFTGSQSSLFYYTIRIIEEMSYRKNGTYLIITVWETVMGAFSSNNRLDFKTELESLTNAKIPMPASEVWANARMVRGNDVDSA